MIDWNMFFNTPGVAGAAQQNTLALIILVNNKLNDNIPPKYLKHLNSSGPDIGSWNVYRLPPVPLNLCSLHRPTGLIQSLSGDVRMSYICAIAENLLLSPVTCHLSPVICPLSPDHHSMQLQLLLKSQEVW